MENWVRDMGEDGRAVEMFDAMAEWQVQKIQVMFCFLMDDKKDKPDTISPYEESPEDQDRKTAFDEADDNRDGRLNKEEYSAFIKRTTEKKIARYAGPGISEEEIQKWYELSNKLSEDIDEGKDGVSWDDLLMIDKLYLGMTSADGEDDSEDEDFIS